MSKDYYKILGVKKDATKDEIKNAFRKMSVRWHPDKNPNNKEAEEKFKDIAEAYSVLGDDEKRKEYDNPKTEFHFSGSGSPNFGGMDMDDILKHFGFGGDFQDPFGSANARTVARGSSIRIQLSLTLEDMFNGATKKIRYKKFVPCQECHGSGQTSQSRKKRCTTCGGSGSVYNQSSFLTMRQTCPTCGGQGYVIENPCKHCGGHGVVQDTVETEIAIPKGIEQGMNIVYNGLGNAAPHNQGTSGDLIVAITQTPHQKFQRDGADLYFILKTPIIDAIMGCKAEVKTIDGKKLTAKIPQGTENGYKMRFKDYGMPIYKSNQRGSMIAVVKCVIPNKLNDKEKALLKELKQQENFKM